MSKTPKFRRPKPGQVWKLQRKPGHVVLVGQLDEVDADTFVVRWMDDCGVDVPKAVQKPLRFLRADWLFISKVAA